MIRAIGAQRPNKQARELGYPTNIVLADWGDNIDVFEVSDENLETELAELEDTLDIQVFYGLKVTGEDTTVYQTPETAPEEVAKEREREVAQRKREIDNGDFKRKFGNAPNFRVQGR